MKKLNVVTLISALMISSATMTSQAECLMTEQGYTNVTGEYFGIYTASPGGSQGTGYLFQKGKTVYFYSNGLQAAGTVSGYTIHMLNPPSGVANTGTLVNNCNTITWSNGNSWIRH